MRKWIGRPLALVTLGVLIGMILFGGGGQWIVSQASRTWHGESLCPEMPPDLPCPRTYSDEELALARENFDIATAEQYRTGAATPPKNDPFFGAFDRELLNQGWDHPPASWPFDVPSQVLVCGTPPQPPRYEEGGITPLPWPASEFAPGTQTCESMWAFYNMSFALECEPRGDSAMLCWHWRYDWPGEADITISCVWLRSLTPVRGGLSHFTMVDRTTRYFAECGPIEQKQGGRQG